MSNIPFLMNPDPKMAPSDMTDASAFTSADQTELNHTHFNTDDESILTGTWECAPCIEDIPAYPVHEMMTIVSGKITLTHPDGTKEHLIAGDTFFIAKGAPVVWEITETLRKIYMIAT
ncbi:MAG: cupin domain-containing protein [Roseovarius sp.]